MNTKSIIEIFRGDDSDALGYQTIVGTIHTDLDLTGCKAVFRYLGFFQEFDPIPEDGKLTIVIPSASSMQFPPGFGYASLKVYDIDRKVRTFTNRIPVFVKTMTPCRGGGEFDVEFSPFPELAPLKIFKGPNADDFDLYTGFISKIIDRASAQKYGLSMLFDAMDAEKTAEGGCAASPAAVKAAYDAVIGVLTDNYYTAAQTDEAIDKLAAYYITSDTQGNPFATHADLVNATAYYSGGSVRTPTRNDYAIVVADETHNNEEWRYIYSENEQGVGRWEPQYAVEGVITFDDNVTRTSANGVKSSGIWSAIWGALAALPTGFTSLYDWCVSQLAGKASKADVDPLLFAQYYPDGSVKSTAEFTADIKYNDPDTTNRTITVKPFCVTVDLANDNSSLVGRVVIPPFVDASGNGYISDDGTRFKVVGVSHGSRGGTNENLTAIVAPSTVTTIGSGAFSYCTSLTSVSLPAATTIGGVAFSDCTSLATVDFGDTPRSSVPTLGIGAFRGVPNTCKIIVPYTQYDAWKAASGWSALQQEFVRHAEKADKPATFTTGNLAKFDANGNPVDSGKKPSDFQSALSAQQLANIAAVPNKANASDIPYSLVTQPIVGNAVLLEDRASNSVTISATLSPNTLTINFLPALIGKVRDFALRLNIAAGVTAPEIAWPQGVTLENNGGEVPEIADGGTGGSSTILYFSETENDGTTAKFLVKGETLTAIAQA